LVIDKPVGTHDIVTAQLLIPLVNAFQGVADEIGGNLLVGCQVTECGGGAAPLGEIDGGVLQLPLVDDFDLRGIRILKACRRLKCARPGASIGVNCETIDFPAWQTQHFINCLS